MADLTAAAVGHRRRLVLGDLVAINGGGAAAEAVLHGKRDAGGVVLLELGERNQHVGLGVGGVEIVSRKQVAAVGHREPGVRLLAAVRDIGVDQFDARRRDRKS